MNYTVYRIKSKKFKGMLFLKYKDGRLDEAIMPEEVEGDSITLPLTPSVRQMEDKSLWGGQATAQEIPMRTAREKVIMFCTAFKYYRKVHYVAKDNEKANIKHVPVTRELLDIFFQSPLHHFTIDNYIGRINITRDWLKNGLPDKTRGGSAHPSYWDEAYERNLSGPELTAYRAHLRKLGWKTIHHPVRGTYMVEEDGEGQRAEGEEQRAKGKEQGEVKP